MRAATAKEDGTGARYEGATGRARGESLESLVAGVKEQMGDDWPPRIYTERVLSIRTRSHDVPPAAKNASVEILHTLLGVELKVGRRRISCPDLATARYLSVFARAGVASVAVPYDITKISHLADELESAWQRMLLLADLATPDRAAPFRTRVRAAVARAAGSDMTVDR